MSLDDTKTEIALAREFTDAHKDLSDLYRDFFDRPSKLEATQLFNGHSAIENKLVYPAQAYTQMLFIATALNAHGKLSGDALRKISDAAKEGVESLGLNLNWEEVKTVAQEIAKNNLIRRKTNPPGDDVSNDGNPPSSLDAA